MDGRKERKKLLRADNWSSVFFNAHNYLKSHSFISRRSLLDGAYNHISPARKMSFYPQTLVCCCIFNKQNINFSQFSIHTFCFPFVYMARRCMKRVERMKNIKIWHGVAYESLFFFRTFFKGLNKFFLLLSRFWLEAIFHCNHFHHI